MWHRASPVLQDLAEPGAWEGFVLPDETSQQLHREQRGCGVPPVSRVCKASGCISLLLRCPGGGSVSPVIPGRSCSRSPTLVSAPSAARGRCEPAGRQRRRYGFAAVSCLTNISPCLSFPALLTACAGGEACLAQVCIGHGRRVTHYRLRKGFRGFPGGAGTLSAPWAMVWGAFSSLSPQTGDLGLGRTLLAAPRLAADSSSLSPFQAYGRMVVSP